MSTPQIILINAQKHKNLGYDYTVLAIPNDLVQFADETKTVVLMWPTPEAPYPISAPRGHIAKGVEPKEGFTYVVFNADEVIAACTYLIVTGVNLA